VLGGPEDKSRAVGGEGEEVALGLGGGEDSVLEESVAVLLGGDVADLEVQRPSQERRKYMWGL
jgi:hypothetical protein